MKATLKRVFSFIMALAIVVSVGHFSVFAITEADGVKLTLGASNVTVNKSETAQTVYLSLFVKEDAEISNCFISEL